MNKKILKDENNSNSIPAIKEALVKACIKSRPSYFKPFLESDKVTTVGPKDGFYKFFKNMVAFSKRQSEGDLYLKIEVMKKNKKNVMYYNFYDDVHLHSRLTLIVEESNDSIHLDIMPF